jgi:hypothetical protein
VQFAQRGHRLHQLRREDAHQPRHDARELRVAPAEVHRPVQLLEEEARRVGVARRGQQVGVGLAEARVLETLDRLHALGQRRVARAHLALLRDHAQQFQDRLHLGIHGPQRSATRARRPVHA